MKRKKKSGRTIIVENDNIDKAIRKLRRLVVQNNILKDYNDHRHYTKPSVKKKRKKELRKWKANLWLTQFKRKTSAEYKF